LEVPDSGTEALFLCRTCVEVALEDQSNCEDRREAQNEEVVANRTPMVVCHNCQREVAEADQEDLAKAASGYCIAAVEVAFEIVGVEEAA
jgi:hypothetical protein